MSDYWFRSSDNPLNNMDYTRGGGGYDNDQTRESNDRRADAMPQGSLGAIPRYASTMAAASQMDGPGLAFIDGQLGYVGQSVTGPGTSRQTTGGVAPSAGPGSAGASNAQNPPAVPGAGAKPKASFGVGAGAIGPAWPQDPKKGPAFDTREFPGMIPTPGPDDVSGRQLPFLGVPWENNPHVPNAETIEEEFGDTDFLSPGWFVQWGTIPAHISWNVERAWKHGRETNPLKSHPADLLPGAKVTRELLAPIGDGLTIGPVDEADLPNPMSYAPMSGW